MGFTRNEISNPLDKRSAINEYTNEVIIDSEYGTPLPTNFRAIVLSGFGDQEMPSKSIPNSDGTGTEEFYFVRVRPMNVQEFTIPSPFLPMPACESKNLILSHPIAFVKSGDIGGKSPEPGGIYECRFLNDKKQTGIRIIEHVGSTKKEPINVPAGTGGEARAAIYNGGTGTVGDDTPTPRPTFDREILSMEYDLPAVSELIQGVGYPPITATAEAEHAWWQGKKETTNVGVDQSMKDKLLQYWNNVGFPQGGVDGCKGRACPWSAAYVSYLLRGASFTGGTSHVKYTKYNFDTATWKAFSIKKNKDKIKIQLGDILIKARYGQYTSWGSSHGDVIYKIKNNKAYSSGGNVSGTAKMAASFALTSDGFLSNPGEYVVILKKMK